VIELYLRAAEAEQRPWRDWESDAADFFSQALEHAPEDPVLLSGLALSLMRGAPPYERERYLRARDAADRSLLRGTRSAAAQLACGVSLFVANEGPAAVEALRRALSLAPSVADAHSLLAAMASDVGLLDEAIARARLTLALDPRVAIGRFVAARALEMKGDHAGADALLDEGLSGPPSFGHYLCALSVARFGLWRGTAAARNAARTQLGPHAGHPLIGPLAGLLEDTTRFEEVIMMLAPIRLSSIEWARQRALGAQLEAELLLYGGADDRAIAVIARLEESGSFDAAWFTTCPLLTRIAGAPPVQSAQRAVTERAALVREALWALSEGRAK
jgi:tetratricopeptide (TPR) repeat protein